MRDDCRFCQKCLRYIPILRKNDFSNLDHLVEHDLLLVYSVCYVVAKFLPGGTDIRTNLQPEISGSLQRLFMSNCKKSFSTLKALVILYTFTDLPPSSRNSDYDGSEDLPFWSVKTLVELFAQELSLHRSIEELQLEVTMGSEGIFESLAYQKYCYWLQTFSQIRHNSISPIRHEISGCLPICCIKAGAIRMVESIPIVGGVPETIEQL